LATSGRKSDAATSSADRDGVTPLAHAQRRGYSGMIEILARAGAK
jgi:hypothetical protein